jgi:hypothetical protein
MLLSFIIGKARIFDYPLLLSAVPKISFATTPVVYHQFASNRSKIRAISFYILLYIFSRFQGQFLIVEGQFVWIDPFPGKIKLIGEVGFSINSSK